MSRACQPCSRSTRKPRGKATLPRGRRVLSGFEKDEPPGMRDPCPMEAGALLVDQLLKPPLELERVLAALAFAYLSPCLESVATQY